MMFGDITAIRILPNDKATFETEQDFHLFFEETLVKRGGLYYFPKNSIQFLGRTLVLFQYDAMIRAVGVIVEAKKEEIIDERGVKYAGFYRFDMNEVRYLENPMGSECIKKIYPSFRGFNQTKHIIPLECLDSLKQLLSQKDSYFFRYSDDSVLAEEIENEIDQLQILGATKDIVVKVRVNQSVFRDKLLTRYRKCCLCGVSDERMLIASHIKPWSVAKPGEKLDIDNGFIFCPNHDKLFDQGFITFLDNGKICISDELNDMERLFMNIQGQSVLKLTDGNRKYLQYHRNNIFKN